MDNNMEMQYIWTFLFFKVKFPPSMIDSFVINCGLSIYFALNGILNGYKIIVRLKTNEMFSEWSDLSTIIFNVKTNMATSCFSTK